MMTLNSPQHVRLMRSYERTGKKVGEYISKRDRVPDSVREAHQEALFRLRWFLDNVGCPKLQVLRVICLRCQEFDNRSEDAVNRFKKTKPRTHANAM